MPYPRTRRTLSAIRRRLPAVVAGTAAALRYRSAGTTGSPRLDRVVGPAFNAGVSARKYLTSKKKKTIHQNAKLQVPGHGAGGTFTSVYMKKPLTPWLKGMKKTAASNFSYGCHNTVHKQMWVCAILHRLQQMVAIPAAYRRKKAM